MFSPSLFNSFWLHVFFFPPYFGGFWSPKRLGNDEHSHPMSGHDSGMSISDDDNFLKNRKENLKRSWFFNFIHIFPACCHCQDYEIIFQVINSTAAVVSFFFNFEFKVLSYTHENETLLTINIFCRITLFINYD